MKRISEAAMSRWPIVAGVPSSMIRPPAITAIRSASRSASSM